ncbi:hypothetical protein CARUB_v10011441mg [Capsella rubella]|uniref:Uncharacterized protein n=1 Tax=Capsella rubella TaxID=81985 RepID=R0IHG8_9BRAS|nr:hypothetical protein CARUB_v10011441mg [Capsella rubella]
MARNGVNKTLLISSLSFFKNLCILITIPILFLSDIFHASDLFNTKTKSYLHDQEGPEGQETRTNLHEEEDGLIEISLVGKEREKKLESVKKRLMSKEEYYEEMMIMEIWEEIEAEDNLIEIDISIGSIV